MPPCQFVSGCTRPELVPTHKCNVCEKGVHNMCLQDFTGVEDAPEGGFTCGRHGKCVQAKTLAPPHTLSPGSATSANPPSCAAGSKCACKPTEHLSVKKDCCERQCHLFCARLPCEACELEYPGDEEGGFCEGEALDVEALDSGERVGGAHRSASNAQSSALDAQGADVLLSMASALQAFQGQKIVQPAPSNGNGTGSAQPAGLPVPSASTGGIPDLNGAPGGPVQPSLARQAASNNKGVSATPTRGSMRIRHAQEAQAEAEEVALASNTMNIDVVSANTIISTSVRDAVSGYVKSPVFVKTLAGVVKDKLFEGAVVDANKKLPVNKAQLKKAVQDNTATAHGILKSALQPQLKAATEGMVDASALMKTAGDAMDLATAELKAATGVEAGADTPVEAKRGGRKGKAKKGVKSASLDKSGEEEAILPGTQHEQLLGDMKDTLSDTLSAKVEPRFQQLTNSIETALQQSVGVGTTSNGVVVKMLEMLSHAVIDLRSSTEIAVVEIKAACDKSIQIAVGEMKAACDKNNKEVRQLAKNIKEVLQLAKTVDTTKDKRSRTAISSSSSTTSAKKKSKRVASPLPSPSLSTSSDTSASDSSVGPPTPSPEPKKSKKKLARGSSRTTPANALSGIDTNTVHMSQQLLQQQLLQLQKQQQQLQQSQQAPALQQQQPQQIQPPPALQQHQTPPPIAQQQQPNDTLQQLASLVAGKQQQQQQPVIGQMGVAQPSMPSWNNIGIPAVLPQAQTVRTNHLPPMFPFQSYQG